MEVRVTDTCPRCGGNFQRVRQFTRWGRTISVLLCRDCQYTRHALVTIGVAQ
jgi:hypothetical protein